MNESTILSYQSGWMVNQTWAAAPTATYQQATPDVSIGPSLWNAVSGQVELKSTTGDFTFGVESFSLGQMSYDDAKVPTTGSFTSIADNTNATVALNARGLGLPSDMFDQFSTLVNTVTPVTCTSGEGGYCYTGMSCSKIPALWDLQFKVKFTDIENYMVVPLGSFTYEHFGTCFMQIEPLEESQPQSSNILFGALFM